MERFHKRISEDRIGTVELVGSECIYSKGSNTSQRPELELSIIVVPCVCADSIDASGGYSPYHLISLSSKWDGN